MCSSRSRAATIRLGVWAARPDRSDRRLRRRRARSRRCAWWRRAAQPTLLRAIRVKKRQQLRRLAEVVLAGGGPVEKARQHRLTDVVGIDQSSQARVLEGEAHFAPDERLVAANQLLGRDDISSPDAAQEVCEVTVFAHEGPPHFPNNSQFVFGWGFGLQLRMCKAPNSSEKDAFRQQRQGGRRFIFGRRLSLESIVVCIFPHSVAD